eukprot:1194174-Prorocentrum_minimum.AAC.4
MRAWLTREHTGRRPLRTAARPGEGTLGPEKKGTIGGRVGCVRRCHPHSRSLAAEARGPRPRRPYAA